MLPVRIPSPVKLPTRYTSASYHPQALLFIYFILSIYVFGMYAISALYASWYWASCSNCPPGVIFFFPSPHLGQSGRCFLVSTFPIFCFILLHVVAVSRLAEGAADPSPIIIIRRASFRNSCWLTTSTNNLELIYSRRKYLYNSNKNIFRNVLSIWENHFGNLHLVWAKNPQKASNDKEHTLNAINNRIPSLGSISLY